MNATSPLLPQPISPQRFEHIYIKLQLEPTKVAAFPIAVARETLVISRQQVTAMPNMPTYVLGLVYWRNHVLWMVDLPQLLGLLPLDANLRDHSAIVVCSEQRLLVLAVFSVEGVIRLTSDAIERSISDTIDTSLMPYIQGYALQETEQLLMLDAKAVISGAELRGQAHRT
jgi:twitching motility protein PilI